MPDPNHIPGYDAWKTSGPPERDELLTTTIQITVDIEFLHDNPDSPTDCAQQAQEAISEAIRTKLGLNTADFEVNVELAIQETHEA